MSKELEYIQRQIDIVKQQVKGSKMKIIVTDVVTKHQYDYYENELQTLENIENALQRLDTLEKGKNADIIDNYMGFKNDNAEPSEALECLEFICKILKEKRIDIKWLFKNEYTTIKQALLKAEKEHNSTNLLMQELDCKDFADLRKYARCGYEKMNEKLIQ